MNSSFRPSFLCAATVCFDRESLRVKNILDGGVHPAKRLAVSPFVISSTIWPSVCEDLDVREAARPTLDVLRHGLGLPADYSATFEGQSITKTPRTVEKTWKNQHLLDEARLATLALLRKLSFLQRGVEPKATDTSFRSDPLFIESEKRIKAVENEFDDLLHLELSNCPRCKLVGDLPTWFGLRKVGGEFIPQSWCRICRRGKTPDDMVQTEVENLEIDEVGPAEWFGLAGWGRSTGRLTPWERNFVYGVGQYVRKHGTPSGKQAPIAARILAKARTEGYPN